MPRPTRRAVIFAPSGRRPREGRICGPGRDARCAITFAPLGVPRRRRKGKVEEGEQEREVTFCAPHAQLSWHLQAYRATEARQRYYTNWYLQPCKAHCKHYSRHALQSATLVSARGGAEGRGADAHRLVRCCSYFD